MFPVQYRFLSSTGSMGRRARHGRRYRATCGRLDRSAAPAVCARRQGDRSPHGQARAAHHHSRHPRFEAYVVSPSRRPGRPAEDRPAIARAFVGKAVLNIPTTVALIERLLTDRSLRRISGWERRDQVPGEAKFSRVFKEFTDHALPKGVHEQLIRHGLGAHLLGHLAREKPQRRSPDGPPPAAPKRPAGGRARARRRPPSRPPGWNASAPGPPAFAGAGLPTCPRNLPTA
jgi:Transposase domain (DUF772)